MECIIGTNDLATTHPILSSSWHPTKNGNLTPFSTSILTKDKIWWSHLNIKSGLVHEWPAKIASRVKNNSFNNEDCRVCSNRHTQIGVNDLATTSPDIAAIWHPTKNEGLNPFNLTSGAQRKSWFSHLDISSGIIHEWTNKVYLQVKEKECKICSNCQLQVGVNDLLTKYPEIASEWHPTLNGNLTPRDVRFNDSRKVFWIHTDKSSGIEHIWPARIDGRSYIDKRHTKPEIKHGCSVCQGHLIQVGANDFGSQYPTLAREWSLTLNYGLTPQMVTKGDHTKIWWERDCFGDGVIHMWPSPIGDRIRYGCSVCAGRWVQIGVNDLGSQFPDIAAEWHPTKNGTLTPQMVTKGSNKKVWWQCPKAECRYEWPTNIGGRTRKDKGSNCPECAKSYFDSTKSAMLYVITDVIKGHQVIQFGISNKVKVRLRNHYNSGFKQPPIALIPFTTGKEAQDMETMLKRLMRAHHIPTCTEAGIKFDGSTEAFRITDATASFKSEFEWSIG